MSSHHCAVWGGRVVNASQLGNALRQKTEPTRKQGFEVNFRYVSSLKTDSSHKSPGLRGKSPIVRRGLMASLNPVENPLKSVEKHEAICGKPVE